MTDETQKHTPGPWIAIPSKTRFHGHNAQFDDGLWHILPESHVERLPICSVDQGDDHDQPTRKQSEFNARLIAAAPELLEALKLAEDHFASSENCGVCHPVGDCPTLRVIRAAIAKAEGRDA